MLSLLFFLVPSLVLQEESSCAEKPYLSATPQALKTSWRPLRTMVSKGGPYTIFPAMHLREVLELSLDPGALKHPQSIAFF